MFLIAGTTDHGRHRACTATAAQALNQHREMTAKGLAPIVTDLQGRAMTIDHLRGRAQSDVGVRPQG